MTPRRPASSRVIAAIVFVVAAGFIAWLMTRGGPVVHKLADGREFSIVAVTYGTNHVIEQGPPWARMFARLGRQGLADRFGYSAVTGQPGTNASVMVWTSWRSDDTNQPPRYAAVLDADGMMTEPAYLSVDVRRSKAADRLVGWKFENYPRHQSQFTLRLYNYDLFHLNSRIEGEVMVKNSVRAPAASPAPPAPVTAKDNEVEATLASLTCGETPPRLPLTAKKTPYSWTKAVFEFKENGLPSTNWTVKRIEGFSATGNYLSSSKLFNEQQGGRRTVRFAAPLWKDEMDWSLAVELARTRDFPTNAFWTFRLPAAIFTPGGISVDAPSPPPGIGAASVRLQSSTALKLPEPRPLGLGAATVIVTARNATPDVYVDLVEAVDDQGRALRILNSATPWPGRYQSEVEVYTNSAQLDLTFAVHQSRRLVFRVKPVVVSTNSGSN